MNVREKTLRRAVGMVVCIVCVGCQAPQRFQRAAGTYTAFEGEQGAQHALCAFGTPDLDETWEHGATVIVDRPGYILEHSSRDKIALWVCERVDKSHITGSASRRDNFKADPRLARGERAEMKDYRGTGYDRGHQAPAGDFKHSQDRMNDSFFLSNMAPQIGSGFNRDIWRFLEADVREVADNRGQVFVVTGGMFYDPDEESPDTADGFIEFAVIGPNDVAVPTHFYKVLTAKNSDGQWEAIGFVLENRAYPRPPRSRYDFAPFVRAIEWIEERAGINFMPLLDVDNEELRADLEDHPAELWPAFVNN